MGAIRSSPWYPYRLWSSVGLGADRGRSIGRRTRHGVPPATGSVSTSGVEGAEDLVVKTTHGGVYRCIVAILRWCASYR